MSSSTSAQRFLPLKPVVLEILMTLAQAPAHGYGILQSVRERSHGQVHLETGPLYRYLKRLLDDGLVTEADDPDDGEDADQRRRYYRLTSLGREVLALEGQRLAGVVARSKALGLLGG